MALLTGGPRIDGLGGTASSAKRAAPKTTTTSSPTRTQTFLQKEAIDQKNYDAGRSPGVSASWAPQVTTPTTAPTYTPPTAPPPVVDPPTREPEVVEPEGPGGSGNTGGTDLGRFTEAEIEAALAALEAQYGMTREQLLMDQTQLGAQARLLMARMERQRQLGVQAAESDAVGRGIYRSGILGENVQGIENQYQESVAQAEQQRLAQEQAIQTQLQFLQQQKAAEAAQIQAGILRSSADYANQAGISAAQAGLQPAAQAAAPYAQAQNRFIQTQMQGAGGMAPISVDPRGPQFLPQGY